MFRSYREYIKDNPQRYWFKRKLFGWALPAGRQGWTPATWQGWVITGLFALLVFAFGLTLNEDSPPREVAFTFLLPVALLSATLILIAYRTGEKPKWMWGKPVPSVIRKSAWIVLQHKKVLFARCHHAELFYSVGGKIEKGETPEEALKREVLEEVGVTLNPESIVHLHTFVGPAHGKGEGVLVELRAFTAKYNGELTPLSEIAELAWLSSNDGEKTTESGRMILAWLKEREMIE